MSKMKIKYSIAYLCMIKCYNQIINKYYILHKWTSLFLTTIFPIHNTKSFLSFISVVNLHLKINNKY